MMQGGVLTMNVQQTERLLNYLKQSPLLEGYCFAVYSSSGTARPHKINRHLCGTRGIPHLCHKICLSSLNAAVDEATSTGNSKFFLCPLGLLSFAIPLSEASCLVCSGLRENLFDLYFYRSEQLQFLKDKNIYPFEILEQLEQLPVSSEREVRETMLQVEHLVKSACYGEETQPVHAASSLNTTILSVAESMRRTDSFDKAVALFSESLGILFDIPGIALVLKDDESNCCMIESCWGAFRTPAYVGEHSLPFHDANLFAKKLNSHEVRELFPGCKSNSAVCLPLSDDAVLFGMVVFFDTDFTDDILTLCKILTTRLVEKLKIQLESRETRRQLRVVTLLEMIRTLSLTENQEDLLRLIVEMAADLVDASNGSLMIIDKKHNILHVVSALGIHPAVARSLTARIGEGIAGRVAVSGTPILVTDIEKEQHIGRGNRIRFGTKSCISLPLSFKGATIGVLNLADKKNNAPFTPADQDILSKFSEQATIILGRTTMLKKARMNNVADPLTGLYTLRFLKQRLNEELSRAMRHNLQLCVIVVNLETLQIRDVSADADQVLKKIARILVTSLRDIDLLGRSGETEFCLVLPSTTLKEGRFVAERIERAIRENFNSGNGPPAEVCPRVNAGIASFPENGASVAELIKSARTRIPGSAAEGSVGKYVPDTFESAI
jgi:diguanylate cyclase (GGDEF)-like protein